MRTIFRAVSLMVAFGVICGTAEAQNVKVTPIGQKTGEFCAQDRAILFEDPTGVKILYDPANTVAGGTDSRLLDVHVILVSHAHSDHLGNARLNQDPDSDTASCTGAAVTATANSNTAEIAAAKNSAVFAGGALANIISRLIAGVVGSNTANCAASGLTNETVVPRSSPCTGGLGLGSKRTVRMMTATRGVQIAAVTAEHPNDLSPTFIAEAERADLQAAGLGAYVGVANGFVLTFTNGLTAYLSGDTGLTSDMGTIVHDYYGANLAVINIGDIFTTGPEEAVFAVTNLIRPLSVIPSHVNEEATRNGQPFGARTSRFVELLSRGSKGHSLQALLPGLGRVSVHLPLSGATMQFNRFGRCEVGCQGR
jgi:L-ascorbate metabolism protein UlaG (beta-lactamase superfamily)